MATTITPQLTPGQQAALTRARKALADSMADSDTKNYPRNLGRLEVVTQDLLELVDSLTGNAG
jgi:hypothetical protein